MAKQRVLVDTNVIIEAFRTGFWNAICGRYSVETVESVVGEALTGDPGEPGYVVVDAVGLRSGLTEVHPVSDLMRADFAIKNQKAEGLDLGERDLLAWIFAQGASFDALVLLSTADKAAIVVAGTLQCLDRLESLQALALASGITPHQSDRLKHQFTGKWLDGIRTKVRLGIYA